MSLNFPHQFVTLFHNYRQDERRYVSGGWKFHVLSKLFVFVINHLVKIKNYHCERGSILAMCSLTRGSSKDAALLGKVK